MASKRSAEDPIERDVKKAAQVDPMVKRWAETYSPVDIETIVAKHNQSCDENWAKTAVCAPYINGTACCGKSTLVRSLNTQLGALGLHRHELPEGHCDGNGCTLSVKPVNFYPKGFAKGKDQAIIRASVYQAAFFNLGLTHYTLVGDRCPLNNMIWRFIMMLLDVYSENTPTSLLQKTLSKWMDSVPDAFWESAKIIPTIIVIDPDVEAVQKRMLERKTGSDEYRATVPGYVQCQNLAYLELARRCGYTVWLVSDNTAPIEQRIIEKIKSNVAKNGLPPHATQHDRTEHFTVPCIDEERNLQRCKELLLLK